MYVYGITRNSSPQLHAARRIAACHNKYKIYLGGTSIVHVHYNIPLPILAFIV